MQQTAESKNRRANRVQCSSQSDTKKIKKCTHTEQETADSTANTTITFSGQKSGSANRLRFFHSIFLKTLNSFFERKTPPKRILNAVFWTCAEFKKK